MSEPQNPSSTARSSRHPRLSLGPISYYWPKAEVDAFYAMVAESPVDIVYLGETICSKRNQVRYEDWIAIAERLAEQGKEVVLSTLTLLEAESELKRLRAICGQDRFLVEANDMGAVQLRAGRPFAIGPSVNCYNERTLAVLAKQGLTRWALPVELTRETLEQMQRLRPAGVETEVMAYGRLPLAYSARCFTARHKSLPKDDCQDVCMRYPDGLVVNTQDDQEFLVLNGIQTQSAQTVNLLAELPAMSELAVDVIRISPQSQHMEQVIALFDQALRDQLAPSEAAAQLDALMPVGPCNGYWHGEAGMAATAAGLSA
jgi:collagenase-like PrtC family protease